MNFKMGSHIGNLDKIIQILLLAACDIHKRHKRVRFNEITCMYTSNLIPQTTTRHSNRTYNQYSNTVHSTHTHRIGQWSLCYDN